MWCFREVPGMEEEIQTKRYFACQKEKKYCISRPIRRTVIFSLEILEKIMMNVF